MYDMVYELLKLVLPLPVATATVERVFSAMVIVKTKLRNKMGDSLFDDYCLVILIERSGGSRKKYIGGWTKESKTNL